MLFRCSCLEILDDFIFDSVVVFCCCFLFSHEFLLTQWSMCWELEPRSPDGLACPSQVLTSCCTDPGIKGSTEWPFPSTLHLMTAVALSSLGFHGQRNVNKMIPLLKRSLNSNFLGEMWFLNADSLFKIQTYLWLGEAPVTGQLARVGCQLCWREGNHCSDLTVTLLG